MTAIQLNAELFRELSLIAEDEGLMKRVLKAVRRIASQAKKEDPALMTEKEFFSHIEKAEQQYAQGEYTTQLPGESVSDMLKRCGYAI